MDGASAGGSTAESSSVATLGPTGAERFITTPHLYMEIIEDSLPRVADSERADLRVVMGAGLAQPRVADSRADLEATRGRPTASLATGDSPAANEVLLDDQARRALVVSAAAAAVSRADSLRMETPAVRMAADTLVVDMPVVDTAAAEVTAAEDMAAGGKRPV